MPRPSKKRVRYAADQGQRGRRGHGDQETRARPSSTSRRSTEQTPPDSNQSAVQQRQLPGFVWDAERGRYFPVTSRAPDRIERQNAQREHTRVSTIEAAQETQLRKAKETAYVSTQMLLRRQAADNWRSCLPWKSWQRNDRDRLLLGGMLKNKTVLDSLSLENQITAIGSMDQSATGQGLVAVGYKHGVVMIIDQNATNGIDRLAAEPALGEITSIQWVSRDLFVYSSIGDDQLPGCVVLFSKDIRQPIERRVFPGLVFGASCLQPMPSTDTVATDSPALLTIAAGITRGMSVVNIGRTCSYEKFKVSTGTDILSTTFINGPNVIAGGGRDGRIRLFDTRIDAKLHKPTRGLLSTDDCRHSISVHGLHSSQGWILASASMDSQVRVWDVRMTRNGTGYKKHGYVPSVACLNNPVGQTEHMLAPCRLGFSAKLDVVAAASSDSHVRMWSMTSGKLLRALPFAAGSGSCQALDLEYDPAVPVATLYVCQQSLVTSYSHRFKTN